MSAKTRLILFALPLVSATVLATAAMAAGGLDGSWRFIFHTDGGDREYPVTLKVTDTQVSGKLGEFDVKGTFKEGALELAFPVDVPDAGSGTLVIKGALAEGALTGNWEFNGYSGNFNGARQ
jgi:hypothetical protein